MNTNVCKSWKYNLFAFLALGLLAFSPVWASVGDQLDAPDELGPFNIGVIPFAEEDVSRPVGCTPAEDKKKQKKNGPEIIDCRVVTGHIYYPTREVGSPFTYSLTAIVPNIPVLPSVHGAIEDAAVADEGPYPLVMYISGLGNDADDSKVMEVLASHGFIGISIQTQSCDDRRFDPSFVIDVMEMKNSDSGDKFFGLMDLANIGVSGISAGGGSALTLIGGNTSRGHSIEDRITSAVLYEPVTRQCGIDEDDWASITVPYITLAGSTTAFSVFIGILAQQELISTTSQVSPRYLGHLIGMTHLGSLTQACEGVEATREKALSLQTPPLVEPLVNFSPEPFSQNAFVLWNLQLFSPLKGLSRICSTVGVDSPLLSTDLDPVDGINDYFMLDTPPDMQAEVSSRLLTLYTVAFWKVHLSGDLRYQPFLTPGYAESNELPVDFTVRGGNSGTE